MSQLSGWAGRAADILQSYYNTGTTSMSISLGGNNVFQVGNTTQQFVITPSGAALSFEGNTGGDENGNPLKIKNSALRGTLEQHYTNLLTESFSRLTKQSDDAQLFFQAQFDSPTAQLGDAVNALFPSDNYVAMTLKAVVQTIKIRSLLGLRRQTFFVSYGGWDHHTELLNTETGEAGLGLSGHRSRSNAWLALIVVVPGVLFVSVWLIRKRRLAKKPEGMRQ